MGDFTIQSLKKAFKDEMGRALKYYSLLSVWNNLGLTEREVQLLSYTAIRGTISSTSSKEEFSRLYGSSPATINNMISRLKKMGLIKKGEGKYKVADQINLDFSKDLALVLKLFSV